MSFIGFCSHYPPQVSVADFYFNFGLLNKNHHTTAPLYSLFYPDIICILALRLCFFSWILVFPTCIFDFYILGFSIFLLVFAFFPLAFSFFPLVFAFFPLAFSIFPSCIYDFSSRFIALLTAFLFKKQQLYPKEWQLYILSEMCISDIIR